MRLIGAKSGLSSAESVSVMPIIGTLSFVINKRKVGNSNESLN